MTSFDCVKTDCPRCSHIWNAVIIRSICTWLNPGLVKKFFDHGSTITCPKCEANIRIHSNILVSCPSGSFWIDTADDMTNIKFKFYEAGIVDFEGEVVNLRLEQ
ncbi:MAG: hypothetical protein ACFE7R_06580 [Candidatus Hodarchaeota archaeon]